MTEKEHAEMVANLSRPLDCPDALDKIEHALVGIVSEAGEMLGAFKKFRFYKNIGEITYETKLVDEGGDVLFYLTDLARLLGLDLEAFRDVNHAKLSTRYPEGFNKTDCTVRDKEKEQDVINLALGAAYERVLNEV